MLVLFGCGSAVRGSGCHVNPAVSLGVFITSRMPAAGMVRYWMAQFAGALLGAAILAVIAGSTASLGQNGWGPGYLGEYALPAALVFEVVFTAILVIVTLGSTGKAASAGFARLAIGLTLAAIHLVGIQFTGVSVNRARSFGPPRRRTGSQAALAVYRRSAGRQMAGKSGRSR
nr:aquaporin [Marinicella sp. W31]MDC2878463.1 aquaporin [Marinicella sp. W31]